MRGEMKNKAGGIVVMKAHDRNDDTQVLFSFTEEQENRNATEARLSASAAPPVRRRTTTAAWRVVASWYCSGKVVSHDGCRHRTRWRHHGNAFSRCSPYILERRLQKLYCTGNNTAKCTYLFMLILAICIGKCTCFVDIYCIIWIKSVY